MMAEIQKRASFRRVGPSFADIRQGKTDRLDAGAHLGRPVGQILFTLQGWADAALQAVQPCGMKPSPLVKQSTGHVLT